MLPAVFFVPIPSSSPSWTDIFTALGTVGLAVATVLTLGYTIRVTRQDRKRAQQQLTDDRKNATDLLHQQLQHSEQLAREERESVRLRQLEAGAWAIQVMLTRWRTGHENEWQLVATVTNFSAHTVTKLRAHFLAGPGLRLQTESVDPMSRSPYSQSPGVIHSDMDTVRSAHVLPAEASIRAKSAGRPDKDFTAPDVLVRWRDYEGHEWEHWYSAGEIRELSAGQADRW